MPKFTYFIGGLGSQVENNARKYLRDHPEFVFIDFIDIMISRSSYVEKEAIVSFPNYLNTQSYAESKDYVGKIIEESVKCNRDILMYGAGLNLRINLNFIEYLKIMNYTIKIVYVNVELNKQLKNVHKLNDDPNSKIYISDGTVFDTEQKLKASIDFYKKAATKFKEI